MQYNTLGTAGVKVSAICLGAAFRANLDESVCVRTVERALELGVNFLDTANYYGFGLQDFGRSERILGKALKGKRDHVVVASKVCSPIGPGPNDRGLSRYHIIREVERSLRRLDTDHIDLYLLHQPDPGTRLEETLRAFDDLVHQGKTLYTGCCNFTAVQVCEALWMSDVRRLTPFSCVQEQYNLLNRVVVEPELMPLCRRHGLGLTAYSPLAIGLLTGRYRYGQPPAPDSPWAQGYYSQRFDEAMTPRTDAIVQKLIDIGQARGKTPAQVALAWILDHPEVTSVIIGPDLPSQVDENLGAVGWKLEPEERAELDRLSEIKPPLKFA